MFSANLYYFCIKMTEYGCLAASPRMKNEFVMDMKDTRQGAEDRTSKRAVKKEKVTFGKRVKVVGYNLLAMAVVVAVLPCLALLWVDGYTNHGETEAVPDVVGVQLEDAAAILGDKGLGYAVVERRYKANAAENEVVMQYPVPGSHVKEGRKVGLVVNTIVRPKRSVPSVIDNRTYREAESHIKAAGFVIEAVDTIPGEKDWVYELRCDGKLLVNGEAIPQGSSLTVVIGSGKPEEDEDEAVFDSNFDI